MGPMISSMAQLQSPPRSSSIQSDAQSLVVMFTTAPVQSCLRGAGAGACIGWISLTSSAAPARPHAMCGLQLAPHGVASVVYTPDLSCAGLRAPVRCVLLCYLYNDINTNWIPLANISKQPARKYHPPARKYLQSARKSSNISRLLTNIASLSATITRLLANISRLLANITRQCLQNVRSSCRLDSEPSLIIRCRQAI